MKALLPLLLLAACSAAPPTHSHRMPSSVPDCEHAGWVEKVSPRHQEVINELIAERGHRAQHALWHAVRGGLSEAQNREVIATFGAPWGAGHKLCPSPKNNPAAASYNASGEDFLYMHRAMIEMLRAAWIAKGLKCVRGWDHVPAPTAWPLPPGSRAGPKSKASLALFQRWDDNLQDPAWLKKVSLSQLGFAVEFTIHNNLHMRYAEDRPPAAFRAQRPEDDGAPMPYDGRFPAGWKFDDPGYNWLADPYGAAVNPVFWKIHGYVDHLVDLWLEANGFRSIAEECHGTRDCYEWKGQWVGEAVVVAAPASRAVAPHGPVGAAPPAGESPRARMAHQRLGVVDFPDDRNLPHGPGGPVRAPPPKDVLQTARESVCQEH